MTKRRFSVTRVYDVRFARQREVTVKAIPSTGYHYYCPGEVKSLSRTGNCGTYPLIGMMRWTWVYN